MTHDEGRPSARAYDVITQRRGGFVFFTGALFGVALALSMTTGVVAVSLFLLIVASFLWLTGRRRGPARLSVGSNELVVRGSRGQRWSIALRAIASAHVVPLPPVGGEERARLVIRHGLWRRQTEAVLPSVEDARALLAELHFGPLERPLTLRFHFGLVVTVGVDGVLVAWPLLRRRRFIPHAKIKDVRFAHDEVRLILEDGSSYSISTRVGKRGARERDHDALVERLLTAREAWRRGSLGDFPTHALARGGRSFEAWVRDVRVLAESNRTQYRSASIPTETLWRVAIDPAEPEDVRIGAGLALRATVDPEGRTRLRTLAEATASPRVRVAFLAAADEEADDAAVAQAMRRR